jgi:hypothetical protein
VCHPETIRRCCPCYSAKMFFAARNDLNPSALARSSILGSYSPPNSRDQKPRARPCIIATGSRGLRSRYSPNVGEGKFCELRPNGVLGSSPHARGLLAFQPVLYGAENGDDEKVPTSIW